LVFGDIIIMQFLLSESQQKIVDIIFNKYKDYKTYGDSHKAFTNGLRKSDIQILESSFQEYLTNEKIHIAMVLVEFIPWVIHTDYKKGDDRPGKAILIPWQTQSTATVIFNETCTNVFENYPKINDHVDSKTYEKYLSHCKWDDVQKVSIKEIFEWQRGKAVTWDRNLLHTSDNFIKNNVKVKTALVIFTSFV